MLIVTIESIPGKTLEPLGLVKGSTIQTVNAFRDSGAASRPWWAASSPSTPR